MAAGFATRPIATNGAHLWAATQGCREPRSRSHAKRRERSQSGYRRRLTSIDQRKCGLPWRAHIAFPRGLPRTRFRLIYNRIVTAFGEVAVAIKLAAHLHDFINAYNYGHRLRTLHGLTPYEYICKCWTSEPERFSLYPHHQMPGPHTLPPGLEPMQFLRVSTAPAVCAAAAIGHALTAIRRKDRPSARIARRNDPPGSRFFSRLQSVSTPASAAIRTATEHKSPQTRRPPACSCMSVFRIRKRPKSLDNAATAQIAL